MTLECAVVVLVASIVVVSAVGLSGMFLVIAVLLRNHLLQNPNNKHNGKRKQPHGGNKND